jgi:rRNA biogenesis protein RRP5
MGGDSAPVVAARLRMTDLTAGILTIVAVKEVHSTRAIVIMPDGLTGVVER